MIVRFNLENHLAPLRGRMNTSKNKPIRETPFIASVIAPICRYLEIGSLHQVKRLHDTGFFIGDQGIYLTASHVLADAKADVEKNWGKVGIFPRQQTGGVCFSLTVPIDSYEFAPSPFDVAIGTTNYAVSSFLRLSNRVVEVWQDVATRGAREDRAAAAT